MTEGRFSVRVNVGDALIELEGDDKDWIAAQLDKLTPVLSTPAPARKHAAPPKRDSESEDEAPNGSGGGQRRQRRGSGGARASKNPELAQLLTREVRHALEQFVGERKHHFKKRSDQLAIIATFLQENLQWAGVDADDIYTVCSVMGWESPGNPRAALDNARIRDQYFGGYANGKMPLSHKGENFGKVGSKKPLPEKGK